MDYQELMIDSLTSLLKNGEALTAPVYGIIDRGNEQYFGYFAIVGDCLLVAKIEGYTVTATSRIPLELSSMKMKRSLVMRQYIFDLRFADGQKIKLTLSPRVIMIPSQKENAPRFAEILNSVSLTANAVDSVAASGKKIRRQYFNVCILIEFFPVLTAVILLAIRDAMMGGDFVKAFFEGFTTMVVLLSPFFVLSILNRLFFGEIVAVANDDGLFIDGLLLPWHDISEVIYCPRISSRTRIKKCYAEIHMHRSASGINSVELISCPMYALRLMRKFNPSIKTKIDKSGKLLIALYIFCILIFAVILFL